MLTDSGPSTQMVAKGYKTLITLTMNPYSARSARLIRNRAADRLLRYRSRGRARPKGFLHWRTFAMADPCNKVFAIADLWDSEPL